MTEQIETLYDLKKYLNTLAGDQLGQKVEVLSDEGDMGTVFEVENKKGKITIITSARKQ